MNSRVTPFTGKIPVVFVSFFLTNERQRAVRTSSLADSLIHHLNDFEIRRIYDATNGDVSFSGLRPTVVMRTNWKKLTDRVQNLIAVFFQAELASYR